MRDRGRVPWSVTGLTCHHARPLAEVCKGGSRRGAGGRWRGCGFLYRLDARQGDCVSGRIIIPDDRDVCASVDDVHSGNYCVVPGRGKARLAGRDSGAYLWARRRGGRQARRLALECFLRGKALRGGSEGILLRPGFWCSRQGAWCRFSKKGRVARRGWRVAPVAPNSGGHVWLCVWEGELHLK